MNASHSAYKTAIFSNTIASKCQPKFSFRTCKKCFIDTSPDAPKRMYAYTPRPRFSDEIQLKYWINSSTHFLRIFFYICTWYINIIYFYYKFLLHEYIFYLKNNKLLKTHFVYLFLKKTEILEMHKSNTKKAGAWKAPADNTISDQNSWFYDANLITLNKGVALRVVFCECKCCVRTMLVCWSSKSAKDTPCKYSRIFWFRWFHK